MPQKINTSQQVRDFIQLKLGSTQSIPAGSTTVAFNTTSFTNGTRLTRSGNTVLIGSGVSYVRVSYTLMAELTSSSAYLFSKIIKNTTAVSQSIDDANAAEYRSTSESKIVPVAAGDTISIVADSGASTLSLTPGRESFMAVEVLA